MNKNQKADNRTVALPAVSLVNERKVEELDRLLTIVNPEELKSAYLSLVVNVDPKRLTEEEADAAVLLGRFINIL